MTYSGIQYDEPIKKNPPLQQCFDAGYMHKIFGWEAAPVDSWTEDQKDSYAEGYSVP